MRRVIVSSLVAIVIASGCTKESVAPLTSTASSAKSQVVVAKPDQASPDAISTNIRALHMPYGTLADPGFASADPASPDYATVVSYNRTGDGAIWTGHYLAAESYRYAATGSADALDAVRKALNGVQSLGDVTSPADPD